MKIEHVKSFGIKQKDVEEFINSKNNEVFTIQELCKIFNANYSQMRFHLQMLVNQKRIERYKSGRISLYGSKKAIEKLREVLNAIK